ncbi:DUF927 domain-containing protein [Roseomonas hellenica]|uniref:DUF927 domain-containing protein n=1 Tax=Plastoroseomonas hellenica TaxID=2687306 RepID=A0ABS5F6T5_9PROT|nr:DUF927 domain-containing protein [Plastoroseomonas hellenica]MBR0668272.1 DUF927 domain-containing protein [Plastoroseomonas hellenica]
MDDFGSAFDLRDAEEGPPPNASPGVKAAAENPWPKPYVMKAGGLYHASDNGDEWLAGPFVIEGETRDAAGTGWGLFLSWQDRDSTAHTWTMPRRLLLGEAGDLEGHLIDGGLAVAAHHTRRQKLRDALMRAKAKSRIRTVTRTGWHTERGSPVYISADGAAYGSASERMVLQSPAPDAGAAVACSGTLQEWQAGVAALAVGNDLAGAFLASAFAGPLLDLMGEPGGGVHAFGRSQKGKTTILRMGASAWGPPIAGRAMRNWRSTSNALESVAAASNDGLLALDELGQCDPKEVDAISYMVANGVGKSRANRDGNARATKAWRLVALSTGELDLASKIQEAGKKAMAGQLVRLISVPLPECGPLGQCLHGRADAYTLLVEVNENVARLHGTAAPAFLRRLAAERSENAVALATAVERARAAWVNQFTPAGADGQVQAVARRFGIIAAAGELAAAWGVLPWPQGEAARAVGACFALWVNHRGGAGAHEDADAVETVRNFIAMHGSARFAAIGEDGTNTDASAEIADSRPVTQRAGWRQKDKAGAWEYLILPPVFSTEVCKGRDPKAVVAALRDANLLRTDAGHHATVKVRLTGYGRPRVYAVKGAIFEGGGQDA